MFDAAETDDRRLLRRDERRAIRSARQSNVLSRGYGAAPSGCPAFQRGLRKNPQIWVRAYRADKHRIDPDFPRRGDGTEIADTSTQLLNFVFKLMDSAINGLHILRLHGARERQTERSYDKRFGLYLRSPILLKQKDALGNIRGHGGLRATCTPLSNLPTASFLGSTTEVLLAPFNPDPLSAKRYRHRRPIRRRENANQVMSH